MRPPRFAPLALLAASCAGQATLPPAEADRLRRACAERIASDRELTKRPRGIGILPVGSGTRDHVVIYGADWCEACHIAADYLLRAGIPFVELDIEEDPEAKERLDRTLDRASLPRDQALPVIETRGTVTLGFMPCVLEAAWRE
jgi:glutaredoxin